MRALVLRGELRESTHITEMRSRLHGSRKGIGVDRNRDTALVCD